MTTKRFHVIITDNHPLYTKLSSASEVALYAINQHHELPKNSPVFDLTLVDHEEKYAITSKLAQIEGVTLYTDASSCWGEYLQDQYPQIAAMLSLSFYSPKETVELYLGEEGDLSLIESFLELLKLKYKKVSTAGHGMTFPRVISTIINEAYFAKEDGLASDEAFDTAMKFGVNYPLGPMEWSDRIGTAPLVFLLDSLYHSTGEARYRVAPLLRKKWLLEVNPKCSINSLFSFLSPFSVSQRRRKFSTLRLVCPTSKRPLRKWPKPASL